MESCVLSQVYIVVFIHRLSHYLVYSWDVYMYYSESHIASINEMPCKNKL